MPTPYTCVCKTLPKKSGSSQGDVGLLAPPDESSYHKSVITIVHCIGVLRGGIITAL
jgi:hypothetical protein